MPSIYALTIRCRKPPSAVPSPFGHWRTYHFASECERQAFIDAARPHILDVSVRVETLYSADAALQHWRGSHIEHGGAE